MRDRELYATILGVQAPWTVERVELDVAGGAVHVWLARREDAAAQCPECQTACPIYDHREREWRHLDTCQLQTRLHARVPRVECPTHGVVQSAVPWATPGSKFTLLFERLAIDWLRGSGRDCGRPPVEAGVGRRVGHRAPGGRARPGAPRDARAALRRGGREVLPAPARLRHRGK